MICGSCRRIRVRAVRSGAVVLALFFLAAAADGAPRGRLFGGLRGGASDKEASKTYYQPRELQRERPAETALPAPDPQAATTLWRSSPVESKQNVASGGSDGKAAAPTTVGDPLAAGKVTIMVQEVAAAIRSRRLEAEYSRWVAYLASRLAASVGKNTGSELTGHCRLRWYDRMMRNPTLAPALAERFTRELHQAALGRAAGFAEVLRTAREKLDLPTRSLTSTPNVKSPADALKVAQRALANVHANYSAAVAPLAPSEVNELADRCYAVFVGGNAVGHTVNDRVSGRQLCDLIEKMNHGAMLAAAEDLLPLLTDEFRTQLAAIPEEGSAIAPGASGRVLKKIPTTCGAILVGGRGKNSYRLDEMLDVAVVIDLGGDDEYLEGTVSRQRPALVIIDVKGDDAYRGVRPGIQGGAILGVSLLLDWEGNDVYDARDAAQASSIAGIGILIDNAGNDVYQAQRRVQAHALGGLGILIDRGGDDRYRCAMWGQGFGGPLGFGLLDDATGDDQYFAGGVYPDSYPETPGLEGWAQGVGAGIRQVANGGIGVLLDGSGDDLYEFDYLSHGGGYWLGLGFLRDFAGNDKHLGSTEKSYDGDSRTQPEYQRFGIGWGCHYAAGFLFEDVGDDVYRGWIMGTGFGWDCSFGSLADFGGNDRYESDGGTVQGQGAQGSAGILFDYGGNDVYTGESQGYASPSMSYHPLPACGGNFSFLIDYGGTDEYGCEASNNAITQRGWAGGFLIDRPRRGETADSEDAQSRAELSTAAAGEP